MVTSIVFYFLFFLFYLLVRHTSSCRVTFSTKVVLAFAAAATFPGEAAAVTVSPKTRRRYYIIYTLRYTRYMHSTYLYIYVKKIMYFSEIRTHSRTRVVDQSFSSDRSRRVTVMNFRVCMILCVRVCSHPPTIL